MNKIPPIKDIMTPFPYSIDVEKPLVEAKNMLEQHDIHHLPVTENGKLFGIITLSDILPVLDSNHGLSTEKNLLVRDFTVTNAYVVSMKEPLDNVLVHMTNEHVGSAIIMKGERIAGMFTLRDACRCFADHLRDHCRPPRDGNDIA